LTCFFYDQKIAACGSSYRVFAASSLVRQALANRIRLTTQYAHLLQHQQGSALCVVDDGVDKEGPAGFAGRN
jgi:hypothetical protein